MLIPSITLRLDFGDGTMSGVSSGISLQGEVPTPMSGIGGMSAAMTVPPVPMEFGSGLPGATQAGPPTPFLSTAGLVPPPMSGIGGMSAAMTVPPVPSPDIVTIASASGMTAEIPRPEGEPQGEPEGSKKRHTGKK